MFRGKSVFVSGGGVALSFWEDHSFVVFWGNMAVVWGQRLSFFLGGGEIRLCFLGHSYGFWGNTSVLVRGNALLCFE